MLQLLHRLRLVGNGLQVLAAGGAQVDNLDGHRLVQHATKGAVHLAPAAVPNLLLQLVRLWGGGVEPVGRRGRGEESLPPQPPLPPPARSRLHPDIPPTHLTYLRLERLSEPTDPTDAAAETAESVRRHDRRRSLLAIARASPGPRLVRVCVCTRAARQACVGGGRCRAWHVGGG